MKDHRLRAPSTDGALLAVPPLDEAAAQFHQTAHRLATWDHDFQGRRAGRLRAQVHHEVIAGRQAISSPGTGLASPNAAARRTVDDPLVVTGHQPELFHPGVWVKNFADGRDRQGPRRPRAEPDRR